ncbi:MAG: histone deacetylase [Verrucomicrobia bacterium]|nr:histone deacetylase [Verrucomicrobiota bacterium]
MNIVFDQAASNFGTENHPERPSRIQRSERFLRQTHADWTWISPRIASEEEILRVHSPEHLGRLRVKADFDSDTPYYEQIEDYARRAAGAAIEVVNQSLAGQRAFSLMRPPGHHATREMAMGFCYLNNIAIAGMHALHHGQQKVAIWDFDAHHGNGTESIVHLHPGIRFASVHQYPGYPGTGIRSFDNVRNYTVTPGSDPALHVRKAEESLEELLTFGPDLILVSAGFDAYFDDPITDMTLSEDDFATFGRWLHETQIRSGAVLEGGYSTYLPKLIEAFLSAWEQG